MRIVEFIIQILQAHAQTLQRLAAFFGEEELLQILEDAGENSHLPKSFFVFNPSWFEPPYPGDRNSIYVELECAVRDIALPAVLEFHLWAYPFYRSIVEGPQDLRFRIKKSHPSAAESLVYETVNQAEIWIKHLPISPAVSPAAESAAHLPWVRFRSEVLRKMGRRPMRTI